MLWLGYLAGMLVALKFGKDGGVKNVSMLSEDIKDIHKNLWTEAEQKIFSTENREKLAKLKSQALTEIESFKKESEKEIKRLIKQGMLKKSEITAEVKKLYDHREETIDRIISEAKELAEIAKSESEEMGKMLSKKVDSVSKDLKKDLQQKFASLKKKIK